MTGFNHGRGARVGLAAAVLGLWVVAPATAAPDYTSHPQQVGRARALPVFIDASFPGAEKDQIRSAINEWNQALNGVVKLVVVPTPGDTLDGTKPWVIRKSAGRDGVREPGRKDQNLGTAQPLPMGGGVLIIFSGAGDYMRANGLTLRDVLMRELGHVVGLRHASHGDLLAADYRAGDASCIDKATAAQVAQVLQVPEQALNWCVSPK